jgi:hypothetical protein
MSSQRPTVGNTLTQVSENEAWETVRLLRPNMTYQIEAMGDLSHSDLNCRRH